MITLIAPTTTVLYDYNALAHYIEIWWGMEKDAPWVGKGFSPVSSMHRQAVSSRQWDAQSSVLDDELEKNTAIIIADCMESLEAVERALVMYGNCNVLSQWVSDLEPARAQLRYEQALVKIALRARRSGADV